MSIYAMSLYLGIYLAFTIFFKNQVFALLSTSLPFREFYQPTLIGILFTYINPLIIGLMVGYFFSKPRRKYLYFVNLSLLAGLINFGAFLVKQNENADYWFNFHLQLYYLMLFPLLFLGGSFPYWKKLIVKVPKFAAIKLSTKDYLTASVLGLLILVLNLLPYYNSPFLVGADIYYHAAMTQRIDSFESIYKSPFFWEGKNYYYSMVYFLLAGIKKIIPLTTTELWQLVPALGSMVFIYFYYLTALRISGFRKAGLMATLLVFPFNQILWYDPSLRIFSYTFFSIFLYLFVSYLKKRKIWYLIGAVICFGLTAASHPEIAIHITLITAVFITLGLWQKHKKRLAWLREQWKRTYKHSIGYPQRWYFDIKALGNKRSLVILLSLYLLVFSSRIQELLRGFQISQILVFNEVPFSLFQPYGISSFLVFMFLPLGIMKVIKSNKPQARLLLAIGALFPVIIFYFTYIWSLYHRYFPETAYLGLAIISAMAISRMIERFSPGLRLMFNLMLVSLLITSIYIKYSFINNYSQRVAAAVEALNPYMATIRKYTENGSVVMLSPDDLLNRYVPFYTERYIFSGSNVINKEHQWQVLSFCNGPYKEDCDNRLQVADGIFKEPSTDKIREAKAKYKIDYLFFDFKKYPNLNDFLKGDPEARAMANIDNYALYQLKGDK